MAGSALVGQAVGSLSAPSTPGSENLNPGPVEAPAPESRGGGSYRSPSRAPIPPPRPDYVPHPSPVARPSELAALRKAAEAMMWQNGFLRW